MICHEVRALLAAYLDDALQPHDRTLVESHLTTCAICQSEQDAIAKTQTSIRHLMSAHLDSVAPASDAWERLQAQIALTPAPATVDQPVAQHRSLPRTADAPRQASAFGVFSFGFVALAVIIFVALIIVQPLMQSSGFGLSAPTGTPTITPTHAPTATPTATVVPTATPNLTEGEITFTDDMDRSYRGKVTGQGPTAIILANMSVGDFNEWRPLVEALDPEQFTVIAFNWRSSSTQLTANSNIAQVLESVRLGGFTRVICIGASATGVGACSSLAKEPEIIGMALLSGSDATGALVDAAFPKLFVVGEVDMHWLEPTRTGYQAAGAPKTLRLLPTDAHGTDIFWTGAKEELISVLVEFVTSLPE